MTPRDVVIIGASAAGVAAALAMRQAGHDGPITMIDADPNDPYERPPLSKGLAAADAALTPIVPPAVLDDADIDLRLGVRAERLRPAERSVEITGGTAVHADRVLLATGCRAARLSVPGVDLANVLVLRDASDAAVIGARLREGGPLVLVGGGFIGLELAAVARSAGIDVTVVEARPLPLLAAVGARVSRLVTELHHGHGVRFLLGASVERFVGGTDVAGVLANGRLIPAATVIVGTGVRPNVELARQVDVAVDNGVVVDARGRTSSPWIWAAGDVACQPHPHLAEPSRIEHWETAQRHGAAVGSSIVGVPAVYDAAPYFWSEQYGLRLQMFGRPRVGDDLIMRADATSERFLAFWMRAGAVVAAVGLGLDRDMAAVRKLVEQRAELPEQLLAAPETDLRAIARTAVRRSPSR